LISTSNYDITEFNKVLLNKLSNLLQPVTLKKVVKEPVIKEPEFIMDETEEDIDQVDIKNLIDELRIAKQEREDNLVNIKTKLKEQETELQDKLTEFNDNRQISFREKDREEQEKRKFYANIKTYHLINRDYEEGKINTIPELFEDEFPIFKLMDEDGLLDEDDAYETYKTLCEEISSDEEETTIDEYLYGKTNTEEKEYPPLEEVLAEISGTDSEDFESEDDSPDIMFD
jgi:hypothetical protein